MEVDWCMAKWVNKGVLTLMFEPSTCDLEASWWRVDWCMAKWLNKEVLTLMFEPSTSFLTAVGGWWIPAWRELVNKECLRASLCSEAVFRAHPGALWGAFFRGAKRAPEMRPRMRQRNAPQSAPQNRRHIFLQDVWR